MTVSLSIERLVLWFQLVQVSSEYPEPGEGQFVNEHFVTCVMRVIQSQAERVVASAHLDTLLRSYE